MSVLGNQIVSVNFGFLRPRTITEGLLLINPFADHFQLVGGKQTTLPLHDDHMELQSVQRDDVPAFFDKGVQASMDCAVLSLFPKIRDLVSEGRVAGAPVKDQKRLVKLIRRFLSSTAPGQVKTPLLLVQPLRTAVLG